MKAIRRKPACFPSDDMRTAVMHGDQAVVRAVAIYPALLETTRNDQELVELASYMHIDLLLVEGLSLGIDECPELLEERE